MITNREIKPAALLDEALAEVVDSARENDVPEERIATVLRDHAAPLETVDDGRATD